jgi:transcriptional regulator GlxA family with amidase domain
MDQRAVADLYDGLDRAARNAASLDDVTAAYRYAVAALVSAVENPVRAAQDGNLERARKFIDQHFTERLELAEVARVAGFAPRHFTRLFKRAQSTTFEAYLKKLRIQRAKELLEGTDLSVERVAELAGFAVRPHFHRAFRALAGTTPAAFRERRRRALVYR